MRMIQNQPLIWEMVCLGLLFSLTIGSMAQTPSQMKLAQEGCADGQRDASEDVNIRKWQIIGQFAGPFGLLLARHPGKVPTARTVSRPPAYRDAYINCYKETARKRQAEGVRKGCTPFIATCLGVAAMGTFFYIILNRNDGLEEVAFREQYLLRSLPDFVQDESIPELLSNTGFQIEHLEMQGDTLITSWVAEAGLQTVNDKIVIAEYAEQIVSGQLIDGDEIWYIEAVAIINPPAGAR